MKLNNITEAEAALAVYVPLVAQVKVGTTLDRVWPLMELLGNPQDRLKVIHIAGTSGKTSTAYYMSALLTAAGQKTGLTVSPHIDSVTERVQINGKPIDDKLFCEELSTFLSVIEKAHQKPSYFELLYAFALWVFERQGVDYAVVETGMGGLLDATNVARRPDKLCVITDIGFDHTHILGKTLEAITAQKAGIIHKGNTVFTYIQPKEVMEVIEERVKQEQAFLHICGTREQPEGGLPAYQFRNWQLAYSVYEFLINRDNLQHLTSQVLEETRATSVPARMETKQLHGKTLIMDGAHNTQKMGAFLDSFQRLYPDTKPAVMIALRDTKQYNQLVPLLTPVAGKVITTTFNTTQDLPAHSMDPAILAQEFAEHGVTAESFTDQAQAVEALFNSPQDICIITGSFYLLSQLRNNGYLDDTPNSSN